LFRPNLERLEDRLAPAVLLWQNDDFFTTIAPGQPITIGTGFIDAPFTAADIYIVPSDFQAVAGTPLVEVGGGPPDTVIPLGGAFVDETIGYAAPTSNHPIPPGTYTVVYDQDQNATYGANDAVFPSAFQVVGGNVPPLDLSGLKAQAQGQVQAWQAGLQIFTALVVANQLLDAIGPINAIEPTAPFMSLIGVAVDFAADYYLDHEFPGFGEAQTQTIELLRNEIRHWNFIVADPPDPNFQQATILSPFQSLGPVNNLDAIGSAIVGVGNSSGRVGALADSMLTAIQRYEGAQQANNLEWAVINGRAAASFAGDLNNELASENAALASLSAVLTGNPQDSAIESAGTSLQTISFQIENSGFTQQETEGLASLGLTSSQIDDLATQIGSLNLGSGFSIASVQSAIASVESANTAMEGALSALTSQLDGDIATVEATPGFTATVPTANAGGPYVVNAGATVQLDGSASTDPSGGALQYAWDLNNDGVFDDASGATPTVAFVTPFTGYVGLQVTNAAGLVNVDYAPVVVNDIIPPPIITSQSPSNAFIQQNLNQTTSFSLGVSDPANDPLTLTWYVDNVAVASGPTFVYQPTNVSDVGIHQVKVVAADQNPSGGSTEFDWTVAVFNPNRVTPSFSNLSVSGIPMGENPVTFSPSFTTVSGHLDANGQTVPAGETVQVTLDGIGLLGVLDSSGNFSVTFNDISMNFGSGTTANGFTVSAQPFAVQFSYAGDTSFTGATASLAVPQTTPVATFTPGDLFVELGPGLVDWIHPDGTYQTLNPGFELGGHLQGMAFDSANNLYVTVGEVGTVMEFNDHGVLLGTFGSRFGNRAGVLPQIVDAPAGAVSGPETQSIAFDAAGNAYVAAGISDRGGSILKFNANGYLLDEIQTGFAQITGVAVSEDQSTLYYSGFEFSGAYAVGRLDLATDTLLSNFVTGLPPGATAVSVLPDGGILVAGAPGILRLDSSGTIIQSYNAPGEGFWKSVVLDPSGTSFWAAGQYTAMVYKFDLATGNILQSFTPPSPYPVLGSAFWLAVFGEAKATPSFHNLSAPTISYGTASTTIAGQLTASSPIPTEETVQVTLNGVTQNGTLDSGGNFSTSFSTSSLGVAGTPYAISFSYAGDSNFNSATASSSLTVTPAPLTITADNQPKVYGNPLPFLTVSYNGLVNGDTPSVFSAAGNTPPSVTTTATQTSDVVAGGYPITVSGAIDPNYTISFVNGTLTITPANQTIVWSNPTAIIVGTPLSNTQLNATVSVIGPAPAGALTYTPPAGTVLGVGSGQVLSVTAAATTDYNQATAKVTVNVLYNFSGFLPPLDKKLSFELGRTIPIKFQLTDVNGAIITSLSAVTSLQVAPVNTDGSLGTPFNPTPAGGTVLRNDGSQYIFNWQTKGLTTGTYEILLTLADGTVNTKVLQLTKGGSSAGLTSVATGGIGSSGGGLLGGDLTLYVDNTNGDLTADELARIQDAVTAADALTEPYGVAVTEVSDPTLADVTLNMDTTSAVGGYADGVLGCTTDAGQITIINGWSFYAGSDATQIGSGQYDFETVVEHELGHALGLGHSTNSTSVMYATLNTGTVNRSLTTVDLNVPDSDTTGACGLHAAIIPTLAIVMPPIPANTNYANRDAFFAILVGQSPASAPMGDGKFNQPASDEAFVTRMENDPENRELVDSSANMPVIGGTAIFGAASLGSDEDAIFGTMLFLDPLQDGRADDAGPSKLAASQPVGEIDFMPNVGVIWLER
jgi:hypothetical protein